MTTIDDKFNEVWEDLIVEARRNQGDGDCIQRAQKLKNSGGGGELIYVLDKRYDFSNWTRAPALNHKKNPHIGRIHGVILKDGDIYDLDHGKIERKRDYLKAAYNNHQRLKLIS